MRTIIISILIVISSIAATVCAQKSKLTVSKSDQPVYSVWADDRACGGLRAAMWSDGKGWHDADCMEIATKLSELRDVQSVTVSNGPDIPDMLAFVQYGDHFKISQQDLNAAREKCRTILKEGYAVSGVLAHCKTVVAGVVPYGLKVKP